MPLPHLRHAFVYAGSLRVGCILIFTFFLLVGGFITNRYLGMHRLTLLLDSSLQNLSLKDIEDRRKFCGSTRIDLSKDHIEMKRNAYVTMKPKGSFIIGSISALYWILSIFGIVGMIVQEVQFLIVPMILLPLVAFLVLLLVFFDLGITETNGFLYFYVLTGFAIKLILAGATTYCFLLVYSYYREETGGPIGEKQKPETRESTPRQIIYPTIPPPPSPTTIIPTPDVPPVLP